MSTEVKKPYAYCYSDFTGETLITAEKVALPEYPEWFTNLGSSELANKHGFILEAVRVIILPNGGYLCIYLREDDNKWLVDLRIGATRKTAHNRWVIMGNGLAKLAQFMNEIHGLIRT